MSATPQQDGTGRPQSFLAALGRRASRLAFWVAVVLAWIYVVFGDEGLVRQWQRSEERAAVLEALDREREVTASLAAQVEALRHDDLAIEREVRTQLDYHRPGEIVLIVEDDDPLAREP